MQSVMDTLMQWHSIFSGGDFEEFYDFEMVVKGMMLADFNDDDKIDMTEAKLLALGGVFAWLDLDGDGMLSDDEVKMVVMALKDDVCSGADIISAREGEIESKIPLPGTMAITCAWLIQPNFYYWDAPADMGPSSRRSLRKRAAGASHSEKLRGRVGADGAFVAVPPNTAHANALRAKEHKIREEHRASVRSFEGMPVTAGQYEAFASIELDGMPVCAGALVTPTVVLTSAGCAHETLAMMQTDAVLSVRIGSSASPAAPGDGEVVSVQSVVAHPSFAVDGGFDVGAVMLAGSSAMTPAELYDGGDLGITDCTRMTMSYLGWAADGALKRAGMGLFDYDECRDMYHWATGGEVVGPEELCAKTRNAEGSVDCRSAAPGSPLVVRIPTEPNVTKLVGVATGVGEGCSGAGYPALFTRASSVMQWVLSLDHGYAVHPAMRLQLTVKELGLPAHARLDVYSGSTTMYPAPGSPLDSKCQVPAVFDDAGMGSMLVVLTVAPHNRTMPCDDECFGQLGLEAEFELVGCEQSFRMAMGETQQECEDPMMGGIAGCDFSPAEGPDGPSCVQPPAPMTVPWSKLGPMEDEGKVYSGGLGKRAMKDSRVEYGVWTCIRDWDAEEQRACGARTGELCCYWFDERSRQWHFQGLNSETKLVREEEYEHGLEVERRRLMGHTLRTSPNQLH
mmetsp:Transcript_22045/g.44893  ORF Transcript_22045/g.44893 Transcript_22045/m.44893 type:complete len:679 (-) Transcript_22045:134-2170(-)